MATVMRMIILFYFLRKKTRKKLFNFIILPCELPLGGN